MINFLGLTLGAGFGAVLLIIGILALFKGSLGQTFKGLLGMIPFGSPKLWAIVFIVGGLALGGLAYSISGVQNLWPGTIQTGSLGGSTNIPAVATPVELSNIVMAAPVGTTSAAAGNSSTVQDVNDLAHYTVILANATNMGSLYIAGNVSVQRTGDISKSAVINCEFVAASFKSQTSTTDSNTYFGVATNAVKSKIAGFSWQQTAYINDGSAASTSSAQEISPISFTGGDAAAPTSLKLIGYQFRLPTGTVLCYLNDQNSYDNYVKCDTNNDGNFETTVARITVLKQAC